MFKPKEDKVFVKVKAKEDKVTEFGLIIPENFVKENGTGEVVAVGPGRITQNGIRVPVDVQVGDNVIYMLNVGENVTIDGVNYLVLREQHILASI